MSFLKRILATIASVCVLLIMAAVPGFAQETASAPLFELKDLSGLHSPASRLTLVFTSFFFENSLTQIEQSSQPYKKLLAMTSLPVDERRLAVEELFNAWSERLQQSVDNNGTSWRPSVSTQEFFASYGSQWRISQLSKAAAARSKYALMMWREGFRDPVLAAYQGFLHAESKPFPEDRIVAALEATKLALKDGKSLPAVAAIALFASRIKNEKIKSATRSLLIALYQAARAENRIEIMSLETFIAGGALAKLGIYAFPKFAKVYRLLTAKPVLSGAVGVSTTVHLGLIQRWLDSKVPSDQALAKKAQAYGIGAKTAPARLQSEAQRPAAHPEAISIAALRANVESVLGLEPGLSEALQYASIFAYGETFLQARAVEPELNKALEAGASPRAMMAERDRILSRFDAYMAARELKVLDGPAMAVLRNYIQPFVARYSEEQAYLMPQIFLPQAGGSCVPRAMAFTALFYPAFAKYKNPNLEFGIQQYANHIEAVVFNRRSKQILALQTMQSPDSSEGRAAVLSPKIFLAAFLIRAREQGMYQEDLRHFSNSNPLPRSRFVVQGEKLNLSSWSALLFDAIKTSPRAASRDLNPNPFTSSHYSDRISIPEERRQFLNTARGSASPGAWLFDAVAFTDGKGSLADRLNLSNLQLHDDPNAIQLSSQESAKVVAARSHSAFPFHLGYVTYLMAVTPERFKTLESFPFKSEYELIQEITKQVGIAMSRPLWQTLATKDWPVVKGGAEFLSLLHRLSADDGETMALIDALQFIENVENKVDNAKIRGSYPFSLALKVEFERMDVFRQALAIRHTLFQLGQKIAASNGAIFERYLKELPHAKTGIKIRRMLFLHLVSHLSVTYGRSQSLSSDPLADIWKNLKLTVVDPSQIRPLPPSAGGNQEALKSTADQITVFRLQPKSPQERTLSQTSNSPSDPSLRLDKREPLVIQVDEKTAYLMAYFFGQDFATADFLDQLSSIELAQFSGRFQDWYPGTDDAELASDRGQTQNAFYFMNRWICSGPIQQPDLERFEPVYPNYCEMLKGKTIDIWLPPVTAVDEIQ